MSLEDIIKSAKAKLRQAEKAEKKSFLRCLPIVVPYKTVVYEGHIDSINVINANLDSFLKSQYSDNKIQIAGWTYDSKELFSYSPLSNVNVQAYVDVLRRNEQVVFSYNEHPKRENGGLSLVFFADSRRQLYDFCESWGLPEIFERDAVLKVRAWDA